jgi:hypothetical protein
MRRWAFNSAAVVSTLLCVETVVLWVRGHRVADSIGYNAATWDFYARNYAGDIATDFTYPLDAENRRRVLRVDPQFQGWYLQREQGPDSIDHLWGYEALFWNYKWGFGVGYGPRWQEYHHSLLFPHWFVAGLTAVLPVIWLRRSRRVPEGCCRSSGYNLTGNASGVCPECGTATGVKA